MRAIDGPHAETESTEFARRTAIWLFPSVLLLHAIFIRALAPGLLKANLVAALVGLVAGFTFRWFRRATAVIAVVAGLAGFTFSYLMGIVVPMSYLVLIGQHAWIPGAAALGAFGLAAFLAYRVRVSLREEWSQPLEDTPGVHIATNDWILWREFGQRDQRVLTVLAVGLTLTLVPVLSLSEGSPDYLALALVVGPICIALLGTDPLARWVSFYLVVRRWEAERGIRLRFPALSSRPARNQKKRKPRGRRS